MCAALLALTSCGGDGVSIDSPSVDSSAEAACRALLDALPEQVDRQPRRAIDPDDALGAAWGDPAIVLTCGGAMPEEYDEFASCQEADGVGWFAPDSASDLQTQGEDLTLTTIGWDPIVSVTIPGRYRPGGVAATMVNLAGPIKDTLTLERPCG